MQKIVRAWKEQVYRVSFMNGNPAFGIPFQIFFCRRKHHRIAFNRVENRTPLDAEDCPGMERNGIVWKKTVLFIRISAAICRKTAGKEAVFWGSYQDLFSVFSIRYESVTPSLIGKITVLKSASFSSSAR